MKVTADQCDNPQCKSIGDPVVGEGGRKTQPPDGWIIASVKIAGSQARSRTRLVCSPECLIALVGITFGIVPGIAEPQDGDAAAMQPTPVPVSAEGGSGYTPPTG